MVRASFDRRGFLGLGAGAAAALAMPSIARACIEPPPVVQTTNGPVGGWPVGRQVLAFRGLRYGAPPLSELRFAPPQRPTPWTDVADSGLPPPAMQMPSPSAANPTSELGKALQAVFPVAAEVKAQSEDALFLNVWTPGVDNRKRPVMVWLHGGGFSYGSGGWPIYDGTNLADRGDVVVVTVNHRLNVFGFLHHPRLPRSGNAGMLDLVLALEWVRDNIAAFGGDPGNVTIFGESGGGAKVSYLMAMPAAKGLFHKAIVQSGPGVRAVPADRAAALTRDFLKALDEPARDIKTLRAIPAETLIKAAYHAEAQQPGVGFDRAGFAPVVDGDVIPAQPWDPAAPAVSAGVPMMIGLNKDEMTLFMASAPWFGKLDDAGLQTQAQATFGARAPAVLAALRRDFPGYSPSYLATHLVTYGRMFDGSVDIAERKAAQKAAPAWFYMLEWETPVGPFKSAHALEVPLVFDNVERARVFLGAGDGPGQMAHQMASSWIAFARSGKPDNATIPPWPAYDAARRATMVFNLQSRVVDDPYSATRLALA